MATRSGLPAWAWILIVGGVVVVIGVVALAILAAIALPSLARARMQANEAAAIGAARSVVVAEATAAAFNGGFYVPFECLATPASCLAGQVSEPLLGRLSASGYTGRFVGGPLATVEERRTASAISEKSLETFAYLMVPDQPGTTGRRAFCVDSTGEMCFTEGGAAPETSGGRCSACTPLR